MQLQEQILQKGSSRSDYGFWKGRIRVRPWIRLKTQINAKSTNIIYSRNFTFINKPINSAFFRNFQLVQFIDLGTAWNGKYNGIKRPGDVISDPNSSVIVKIDAGGLGPFAGGYGFGARTTLLGYFLKFDAAWPMKGLFVGKPIYYFALGFDF